MKNIGICIIAYNRLHSLKRVLGTLEKAYYPQYVDLNISIDKSNTDIVRKSMQWRIIGNMERRM